MVNNSLSESESEKENLSLFIDHTNLFTRFTYSSKMVEICTLITSFVISRAPTPDTSFTTFITVYHLVIVMTEGIPVY